MSKIVKRSEADKKYMWNMKDMYENDGLWEDDVKEADTLCKRYLDRWKEELG